MFKATISSDILKDVIGVITTLVDEVKVNVHEDGFTIRTVDPAHVAMVDMSLERSAFEEFEANDMELGTWRSSRTCSSLPIPAIRSR